jgi:hypothetical protein
VALELASAEEASEALMRFTGQRLVAKDQYQALVQSRFILAAVTASTWFKSIPWISLPMTRVSCSSSRAIEEFLLLGL